MVRLLFALEPFAPYDASAADGLLDLLDRLPGLLCEAIEGGSEVDGAAILALGAASSWWATRESQQREGRALQVAFALSVMPYGPDGHFRPELVLERYAYRGGELLNELIPHLVSLGVPYVTDVLAGVYIVGQVLDCDDPVGAYIAFSEMTSRYIAADPAVAKGVRDHLRQIEPALQRTQQAVRRALAAAQGNVDDGEASAHALADAYKRVVEGPFRQFIWGLHCLQGGSWSEPPMLTSLRERLISGGGVCAILVRDVVIPDLRNSETHETLAWDGYTAQFVTEIGRVDANRVVRSLSRAIDFVQGSEAGLAAIRSTHVSPGLDLLPRPNEDGRMPTWDRVRAFFGTNQLILLEARLNSPRAHFRVQKIEYSAINPCFQALVLARRLLPLATSFEVSAVDSDGALIVVDSRALDETMPVWELAVANLDQMPLSTFLPANFDARRRFESETLALRSSAWIAIDDLLDAFDGGPERWDDDYLRLLEIRMRIVESAVAHTGELSSRHPRLDDVHESAAALRGWVIRERPADPSAAEAHPAIVRLRSQWNLWGPVTRHPLVPRSSTPLHPPSQPRLRTAPMKSHYRTI
ncbi:hypothetical protein [Marisediminicola sp. LYQ85]|uniref:hypothetical protein n=1 Tax=Marisediminicola sp. LYQ85 TaxID=3391062 RepID=UPI0039832F14